MLLFLNLKHPELMIRIFLLLFLIVFVSNDLCAQRYSTRNGIVRVMYNHPVAGSLETVNRQVNVAFDVESGEIRMHILMLSFRFDRAFNQEIYNNYFVENPWYSNARFEGHITNIDQIDFDKPGIYTVEVSGDLVVREFANPMSTTAEFVVNENFFEGEALFDVYVRDYMHMIHPTSAHWPDYVQVSMEVNLRRL